MTMKHIFHSIYSLVKTLLLRLTDNMKSIARVICRKNFRNFYFL